MERRGIGRPISIPIVTCSSTTMSTTKLDDIAVPDKQKAWVIVKRGKPQDALVFDENAPVPSDLGEGEILIKVQAAALNPV